MMNNIKKTSLIFFISLLFSFSANAQYCKLMKDRFGEILTSEGGATINNNHYVKRGGAGAGSSTGNVSTCGDSWHSNPTCPRGYGPSKPEDEFRSCEQLYSEGCEAYFMTQTGSKEFKHKCDALRKECEDSNKECIDPAPIDNPQIVSMYERSNGAPHGGIDYSAPYGTIAKAPLSGIYKPNGAGSIRIYDAKTDITAEFHHLFCIPSELKSGDYVKKGETVGWVGNTGQSAAPHMHIGFFGGTSKPASRTGYLNPMANQTNKEFCDLPEDACYNPALTHPDASKSNQTFTKCGTGETVTPTTGEDAGGSTQTADPSSSSGDNKDTSGGGKETSDGIYTYEGTVPDALGKDNKKCSPSRFLDIFSTCLLCNLFTIVYNTVSGVAAQAYATFATPVINVLIVSLAIWIASQVLPFVASLKEKKASELLMTVLRQLFLAFIIITFLKTGGLGFFAYIMEPIFETGFELAQTLLVTNEPCTNDYGIKTPEEGGGLPASMGNNVVCVISQLQASIQTILALGLTSICIAFFLKADGIPILPNFAYLLTGLLLLLGGLMLLVVFPFIVLDSILQLGVAVSLLPFAMASFLFKSTKKYAMNVWTSFMSIVFNFVFLCLCLMIIIKLIEVNVSKTLYESIKLSFEEDNFGDLLEVIGWESALFLKICFIFILSKAVLDEVNSFASQFAGGDGFKLNLSTKAGGVVAGIAGKVGKRAILKPMKAGSIILGRRAYAGFSRMRTQQRANYQRSYYDNLKKAGFVDKNGVYDDGKVKMYKNDKGELIKETKSKNKVITKTYSYDAQGRSVRSVETQDIREQKRAKKALKRAMKRGTETINKDGSKTYTYQGKVMGMGISPRQFSVTVFDNGDVIRSYTNTITGKTTSKTFKNNPSKKVEVQSYDKREYKEYDKDGNLVSETSENVGKNDDIINSDGIINQKVKNKLDKNIKDLEDKLDKETDANKKANIQRLIKEEKQKANKTYATTVLKKALSYEYFEANNIGYAKQEITSTANETKMTETMADNSTKEYRITTGANNRAIIDVEHKQNNGEIYKLTTDSVIQKRQMTTNGDTSSNFGLKNAHKINALSSESKKIKAIIEEIKRSAMTQADKDEAQQALIQRVKDSKKIISLKAFK